MQLSNAAGNKNWKSSSFLLPPHSTEHLGFDSDLYKRNCPFTSSAGKQLQTPHAFAPLWNNRQVCEKAAARALAPLLTRSPCWQRCISYTLEDSLQHHVATGCVVSVLLFSISVTERVWVKRGNKNVLPFLSRTRP